MTNDLELAIQMFRNQAARYRRYERYYKGEHDLSFATEKFQSAFGSMFREFAMNLCPALLDATRESRRCNMISGSISRRSVCMRSVSLIAFVFLTALFSQVSGQIEANSGPTIHKDPTHRYSVSYPSNWRILTPSNPPIRLRLIKDDGYIATFNIQSSYQESRRSKTAKALVKELLASLDKIEEAFKRASPSYKIIAHGETRLSGREAFFLKGTTTAEARGAQREMITYQVQTFDLGNSYTLTFVCEADAFEPYSPVFEGIISSFAIN